jgi:hypothetical protein
MKSVAVLIALLLFAFTAGAEDLAGAPVAPPAVNEGVIPVPAPLAAGIEPKSIDPKSSEPFSRFYFSAVVGYSLANEGKAPYSIVSGAANGTGEYTFNTDTVFFGAFEVGQQKKNALGWDAGVSFDEPREIRAVTFASDSTVSANVSGTKISLGSIYVESVYYFDSFYMKFGGNYSIPGIKSNNTAGKINLDNDLGVQGGVGFVIQDNCMVDLTYRELNFKMTTDALGVHVDYQVVAFNGFQVALKYLF